jgi:PAS domain S-box-containing protein
MSDPQLAARSSSAGRAVQSIKEGEDLRRSEERFRLLVDSVRDYAIFMLDTDGKVLTWNAGAERIKGYRADEIIGQHFSRFYPPEALACGLPQYELGVAKDKGSFEDEGWRVRKDGSLFWANVVITAIRGPDGRLLGFAKVTRDLTHRRDHEEALRRSEERFRLLVEGVPDYAIFMLDANGAVATWNAGARRMKGYAADEIIGRHFSIFYPADVKDSGWPDYELQVAAEKGRCVDEGWRVRKDGTTFWANVTITALRDDSGRLVGYAKLTRDLTESKRTQAVEMVSQQREELLEAERGARIAAQRPTRIKDEFLATLSHELRTPLSAIVGWTHVLRRIREAGEPKDVLRAIDAIDRNARAQARLIDDLLDLSRIMAGKLRLDMDRVAVQDVVQTALDSVTPAANTKGIALRVRGEVARTFVSADSARLQQVLWNLLMNAVKFTPKGGEATILVRRSESHVELSVSDTGIGIAADFLPHVFDRFSQNDSSTTRAFGGLGLGLAISKQLVELHGGSIHAHSPGEGMGSTFVVQLPVSVEQHESRPEEDPGRLEERNPAEDVTADKLVGAHIFVIEDERDARELLQTLLEDRGAKVTTFGTANEALAAFKTAKPAVIVSDIGLPQMDGYQFMRALRASEGRHERTPALALTAFARPEDRKRALVAGYQAHLAKPFDVAELLLVIADLVER